MDYIFKRFRNVCNFLLWCINFCIYKHLPVYQKSKLVPCILNNFNAKTVNLKTYSQETKYLLFFDPYYNSFNFITGIRVTEIPIKHNF